MAATLDELLVFWRASRAHWFSKSEAFDADLRTRFAAAHEAAAAGVLDAVVLTGDHAGRALAVVMLLDQYPRNAFRDTPAMFACDPKARELAGAAIDRSLDAGIDTDLRLFFYLPFAHSEALADQRRSLALHQALGFTQHAQEHHDIVARFGRFPHRNAVLGRVSTTEEERFLAEGGFAG